MISLAISPSRMRPYASAMLCCHGQLVQTQLWFLTYCVALRIGAGVRLRASSTYVQTLFIPPVTQVVRRGL